ncbi:alcohol dehydrogenase (NADP+) [Sarotherodon galilaeus]
MAAFTWIQMSSLLILMLQFKGKTEQHQTDQTVTAERGHDVTLSLKNVIQGQHNCNGTTWIFSDSSSSVALFELGQIKEAKPKSDRLSVSANCSLVIKKVTDQDVGRYTCRQYKTANGSQEGPDFMIDLSVINRFIIVPVGLAALLITVVVIIRWKKTKENKTQCGNNTGLSLNPADTESGPGTNQDMLWTDADDGVSYASISFTKKTKNKARACGDDDDTVMYSTVKASSSRAGLSTDPSDLYSTINKPKK